MPVAGARAVTARAPGAVISRPPTALSLRAGRSLPHIPGRAFGDTSRGRSAPRPSIGSGVQDPEEVGRDLASRCLRMRAQALTGKWPLAYVS